MRPTPGDIRREEEEQVTTSRNRVGSALRLACTSAAMALLVGIGPVAAQDKSVLVMGGQGHEDNMRAVGTAAGGTDILGPFEAGEGIKVSWSVATNPQLQEALQRLGPLSSTAEDVIFVHQFDTNARLPDFLEPLDGYLAAAPIPGFPDDWAPGVTAASVFDGKRYLVPFRCGAMTLWYNDQIFAERGLSGGPKVPEDIYEIAKAATYTRDNGEKVFGVAFRGTSWSITEDLAALSRSYGGDMVQPDGTVTINQPPVVAAVNLLKRLFKEGLMPPNWATLDQAGVIQLFKDNRVAMTLGGTNYNKTFNDGQSLVNGHAVATRWPLVKELQTPERQYGAGTVFYWGLGILKGSQHKDAAAKFIEHVSSPGSVHALAVNGSGPCTAAELAVAAQSDPAMAIQAEIFAVANNPLPVNENINQIRDALGETIQNIVVNDLDTQSELDGLARRLERLYR
jgi:multiple sugar transport system substrate-binding protein